MDSIYITIHRIKNIMCECKAEPPSQLDKTQEMKKKKIDRRSLAQLKTERKKRV